jgi:hypothetical protein
MNLNKLYIRNTHYKNDSGVWEYRRDMYETWEKIPSGFRGVIHLLDSGRPMDLADILSAGHAYAKDWPLENNSEIESNPNILEEVLELLVNFDMVKIIPR